MDISWAGTIRLTNPFNANHTFSWFLSIQRGRTTVSCWDYEHFRYFLLGCFAWNFAFRFKIKTSVANAIWYNDTFSWCIEAYIWSKISLMSLKQCPRKFHYHGIILFFNITAKWITKKCTKIFIFSSIGLSVSLGCHRRK